MGDMADYLLENIYDEYDPWEREFGIPSDVRLDGFDNLMMNEDGSFVGPRGSARTKTCRCCGTTELVWGRHGGRWLLHDSNGVHQCPTNPYGKLRAD